MIVIGGLKGVGKDTTAGMLQYLINSPKCLHSYKLYKLIGGLFKRPYKVTSFAYPLKKTLASFLNIDTELLNNRAFKESTYIYCPTLTITDNPEDRKRIISDYKFNKYLNQDNYSFLQDSYITIRQLLQCFGTNIMRKFFGDKIWIVSTLKTDNIIISDLRFKAEAEECKKRGATLIYISRPSCSPGNHQSEKEVIELYKNNKFDHVIDNNGTLEDLFYKVKQLVYEKSL